MFKFVLTVSIALGFAGGLLVLRVLAGALS